MYSRIPPKPTSTYTVVLTLFIALTLITTATTVYFASVARDLQERSVLTSDVVPVDTEGQSPDKISPSASSIPPVFTYPEIVQVPSVGDDSGAINLLRTLYSWREANAQTCVDVFQYAQDERMQYFTTPAREAVVDPGIRSALLSYFSVPPSDELTFFLGIASVLDEDDLLSSSAMCSGTNRRFLLLDDNRPVMDGDGLDGGDYERYPEILEWTMSENTGGSWVMYPIGEQQVIDGYRFVSDWNGSAVLISDFGDAGFGFWSIQLLDIVDGIPALTMLESCKSEIASGSLDDSPTSVTTCEKTYTP